MTLGTLNKNNHIQLTLVWYEYEKGVFLVSTTTNRTKYKNMQNNKEVTFLIYDQENPYRYVQVRGTVSFSKEKAHDLIDRLSQKYMGKTPYPGDPDRKEDRVIVTITPTTYQAWGF
jgi:PPOX class probable F420-dependent enzyme